MKILDRVLVFLVGGVVGSLVTLTAYTKIQEPMHAPTCKAWAKEMVDRERGRKDFWRKDAPVVDEKLMYRFCMVTKGYMPFNEHNNQGRP